jgi:hypothetical protein
VERVEAIRSRCTSDAERSAINNRDEAIIAGDHGRALAPLPGRLTTVIANADWADRGPCLRQPKTVVELPVIG